MSFEVIDSDVFNGQLCLERGVFLAGLVDIGEIETSVAGLINTGPSDGHVLDYEAVAVVPAGGQDNTVSRVVSSDVEHAVADFDNVHVRGISTDIESCGVRRHVEIHEARL